MLALGETRTLLAPWLGTVRTDTPVLALKGAGIRAQAMGPLIKAEAALGDLAGTILPKLAEDGLDADAASEANLLTEKFHTHLSRDLLIADVMSSRLDPAALPRIVALLTEDHGHSNL